MVILLIIIYVAFNEFYIMCGKWLPEWEQKVYELLTDSVAEPLVPKIQYLIFCAIRDTQKVIDILIFLFCF